MLTRCCGSVTAAEWRAAHVDSLLQVKKIHLAIHWLQILGPQSRENIWLNTLSFLTVLPKQTVEEIDVIICQYPAYEAVFPPTLRLNHEVWRSFTALRKLSWFRNDAHTYRGADLYTEPMSPYDCFPWHSDEQAYIRQGLADLYEQGKLGAVDNPPASGE